MHLTGAGGLTRCNLATKDGEGQPRLNHSDLAQLVTCPECIEALAAALRIKAKAHARAGDAHWVPDDDLDDFPERVSRSRDPEGRR
jgi:hypothetical protein